MNDQSDKPESQKQWDFVSKVWKVSPNQRWFHEYIIEPFISNYIRLQNISGDILDYGCGSAELGRYLANENDVIIDNYDSSAELVNRANRDGLVATNDLSDLKSDYNLIILSLVLSSVEDPGNILRQIKTHLAKKAQVLIIIPHPSFSLLTKFHSTTKREWVDIKNVSDELRYFDNPVQKIFWTSDEQQMFTYTFYKTIEDYFHLFIKHGFSIINIFEPRPIISGIINQGLYEKYSRMPSFLSFILENEP